MCQGDAVTGQLKFHGRRQRSRKKGEELGNDVNLALAPRLQLKDVKLKNATTYVLDSTRTMKHSDR